MKASSQDVKKNIEDKVASVDVSVDPTVDCKLWLCRALNQNSWIFVIFHWEDSDRQSVCFLSSKVDPPS